MIVTIAIVLAFIVVAAYCGYQFHLNEAKKYKLLSQRMKDRIQNKKDQ